MENETKICGQCGEEKSISLFHKRKDKGRNGHRKECKVCYSINRKEQYERDKDYILKRNAEYAEKNKQRIADWDKKYRQELKEPITKRRKELYLANAEQVKERRKEYYKQDPQRHIKIVNEYIKNNLPKVRERQRKNEARRKATDIAYKLQKTLRGRVGAAVRNKGVKCAKTMELIGCSMQHLLEHIESQFTEGMNWSNHGMKGWHLDHKIPVAKFDMRIPEDQRKCFHWSNLQPLWWYDNLEKSAKIDSKYGNVA